MAKDPAFLFYSSDFLNGVSDLTMEERGQYITLLCLQHQKGTLTEKTIWLSLGSASVCVLNKFHKDSNGNFYHPRLKMEIEKRAAYSESRRSNGFRGGRPKKQEKAYAKPYAKATDNHMEDENENENINTNEVNKGVQGELNEIEINSTQEYVKITSQKDYSTEDVRSFWKAFLIHSEGKYYHNRGECISHFRNWLKSQKNGLKNDPSKSLSQQHQEVNAQLKKIWEQES